MSKSENWSLSALVGEFSENGRRLTLTYPLVFEQDGVVIEVPAGFDTDFNSVPIGFWNIFPPWQYPAAGVIHDWLYHNPAGRSRGDCDRVHKRLLEILGCPWWKRHAAYAALRVGGSPAWRKHRKFDEGLTQQEQDNAGTSNSEET